MYFEQNTINGTKMKKMEKDGKRFEKDGKRWKDVALTC